MDAAVAMVSGKELLYTAATTEPQELFTFAFHETFVATPDVESLGDTIKFVSFSPGQIMVLQAKGVVGIAYVLLLFRKYDVQLLLSKRIAVFGILTGVVEGQS